MTTAITNSASDPAAWTSYVSVAVAVLALIVSVLLGLRNRGTAKRALELSERQEARRESRLDLRLHESVSWRSTRPDDRWLGFHLLITNPTDRASSVVEAELHLTYDLAGVVTTLKVLRAHARARVVAVEPVDFPVRLDANDAISGWVLFHIKQGLTGDQPIDRYDVVVRNVHGIEESIQASVFREVSGGEAA